MLKIELVSVDLQSPPDPLNPEVKLGLITLQWNITCPLVLVVYVLLLPSCIAVVPVPLHAVFQMGEGTDDGYRDGWR